jgi:hypothetical protein
MAWFRSIYYYNFGYDLNNYCRYFEFYVINTINKEVNETKLFTERNSTVQ